MFRSCAFEFETKPTNNPQNCIQVQKNTGNVKSFNVIKQLQHLILSNMMCYGALKSNIDQGRNMMCYGALKSNIDRGLRPWSILLFSTP